MEDWLVDGEEEADGSRYLCWRSLLGLKGSLEFSHREVNNRSVKIPLNLTARLVSVSRTTRPAVNDGGAASDGN
jgi:hypothetical protein